MADMMAVDSQSEASTENASYTLAWCNALPHVSADGSETRMDRPIYLTRA